MTSIQSLASQIMNRYDANNDGRIQLERHGYSEASRMERDFESGFDYDIITLSKVSYHNLFQAADTNRDHEVSRQEIVQLLRGFDKNHDGELKNHGMFWNRKGELKDFEKAYPERREIIDRQYIPKPQPINPPYHPYPGNNHGYNNGYDHGHDHGHNPFPVNPPHNHHQPVTPPHNHHQPVTPPPSNHHGHNPIVSPGHGGHHSGSHSGGHIRQGSGISVGIHIRG